LRCFFGAEDWAEELNAAGFAAAREPPGIEARVNRMSRKLMIILGMGGLRKAAAK
jgi:hypothetical protein